MITPKKSVKKDPAAWVEDKEMEMSDENSSAPEGKKDLYDDDDQDEFDLPLDDLDGFDEFDEEDDDDNY